MMKLMKLTRNSLKMKKKRSKVCSITIQTKWNKELLMTNYTIKELSAGRHNPIYQIHRISKILKIQILLPSIKDLHPPKSRSCNPMRWNTDLLLMEMLWNQPKLFRSLNTERVRLNWVFLREIIVSKDPLYLSMVPIYFSMVLPSIETLLHLLPI